jgi:NAD-dependent dihydropyrimidine dehydrogenase PreA subunit
MTEKKYTLRFSGSNLHDSVSYLLVSKFNIRPNILQAKIDSSGGRMILTMQGEEKDIDDAISYLRSVNIIIEPADNDVKIDERNCIDCGACVSICPTFAFDMDRETWSVTLDRDKCIACGICITACPTHAITLKTNI